MKKLLLFFAFIFIVFAVFSQNEGLNNTRSEYDTLNTSISKKRIIIGDISIIGNKVTQDRIIMRELEFQSGDTILMADFIRLSAESRINLINLSIFNFVTIETHDNPMFHSLMDVVVDVVERWYVWPMPIFELADRNFNAWWETKDFTKVNYGFFLTYNNFRGRMELLKLLIRAGYNQKYYLHYEIPYLTRKQNFGMGIQFGRSLSREVPYITENNKQLFYKDEDGYSRDEWYGKLIFSYRKSIHNSHQVEVGYENYKFADTLVKLNPNFIGLGKTKTELLRFTYLFRNDYRMPKPYPLNGHYLALDFDQMGFGVLRNELNFFSIKPTFDIYRPISKRWFWAASITAKYSGGKEVPYFYQRGLGYGNDYVRSFELFVVDGTSFGLLKSNLKFAVVQPQKRDLPLIKMEKFSMIHYAAYLNLLFDVGYVINNEALPSNNYQNNTIVGTGLGLDLVTYYDLVWRFEYTINQFGDSGFFISFVAPI